MAMRSYLRALNRCFTQLTLTDVKHLRLTCRALADLLSDPIFHTLTFRVTRDNMERGIEKIVTLTREHHAACRATRVLSIGLLSPGRTYYSQDEGKRWVQEPHREDTPQSVLAEEILIAHLFDAIAFLQGVHSVRWAYTLSLVIAVLWRLQLDHSSKMENWTGKQRIRPSHRHGRA